MVKNRKGQGIGQTWWVWLILLVLVLVLIGFFMANRFGWLESQAGQVPQSLSTREGICINGVQRDLFKQSGYCAFHKLESGAWVNCEDKRIQSGMKGAGITDNDLESLKCDGEPETLAAVAACKQVKEKDWEDITVGEKKCDAWCKGGVFGLGENPCA
jgi:hypothetical protein